MAFLPQNHSYEDPSISASKIFFEIEELNQNNYMSIISRLPIYFKFLFGDLFSPGWIHNVHMQVINDKHSAAALKDFDNVLKILGPQGKIANAIFSSGLDLNAVIEGQQMPCYVNHVLGDRNRIGIQMLFKYERLFSKNKNIFDFKQMILNLNLQEWFLFVLVKGTLNFSSVSTQVADHLDDFYNDLTLNPCFVLIRNYLIHFNTTGSINYSKLIFILKQYSLFDYTFFIKHQNKMTSFYSSFLPTPKQNIIYILYMLIYFDRQNLPKQEMVAFFNFYMNPSNRGSQAFDIHSLIRLWLYYIRPFDSVEASIMSLILQVDSINKRQERLKYISLKRFNPQSILSSPKLNEQYYLIIKSCFQLYVQLLSPALSSLLNKNSITPKLIYTLSMISVMFSIQYQSSIVRILQLYSNSEFQLFRGVEYQQARQALKKMVPNILQNIRSQTHISSFNQQSAFMKTIYKNQQSDIVQLQLIYHITDNQQNQPQIRKVSSSRVSEETIKHQQNQFLYDKHTWARELGTHEILIMYYIGMLLANLMDFVVFEKGFSWSPKTNLRFLANISVVLMLIFVGILMWIFPSIAFLTGLLSLLLILGIGYKTSN